MSDTDAIGAVSSDQKTLNELVNRLKTGKHLMELVSAHMDEYFQVDGRTLKQWRIYFDIKLPKSEMLNPENLAEANTKLCDAINEAGFWHARALLIEQSIRSGAQGKFDEAFSLLVEDYRAKGTGKLPAEATLRTLSQANGGGLKSAIATAATRAKFWKSIVETLDSQRKSLEQQRWIMYTQLKLDTDGLTT